MRHMLIVSGVHLSTMTAFFESTAIDDVCMY
eukprot:COSAG01_NODE_5197_length_4417_cov_5.847383_2_plen_31_part_00